MEKNENTYFVEYMAYLGELMKKEENIGKSEVELLREYGLYDKLFTLTKCGENYRRKFNIPNGTYIVDHLLCVNTNNVSNLVEDGNEIVAVLIDNAEYKTLNVLYSSVYDLKQHSNTKYFIRKNDNVFIMKQLDELEKPSLDDNKKASKYYDKYSSGPLYRKEVLEDGKIALTRVFNPDEEVIDGYYICDEDYPEAMASLVEYLEADTNYTFRQQELPIRNKTFYTRLKDKMKK